MKKKICVVFGTRPELIKVLSVIKSLQHQTKCFDLMLCHSSQHTDMIYDIIRDFNLTIDITCSPFKGDLCLLASHLSSEFKHIFSKYCPDFVLVQGDTSTAFIAALSAFYLKIPVGHIEAGLRTYDIHLPFPEESHRRCISACATLHFAPSALAKTQLLKEGIVPSSIHVTGNTVVDAIQQALSNLNTDLPHLNDLIQKCHHLGMTNVEKSKYFLITCHRREHWGQPLKNVLTAIKKLAKQYPNHFFVWPVHSNPVIKDVVYQALTPLTNCILLNSLSYLNFIYLMKYSNCIITDSGGIQEEAPSLLKPVILLRNKTERPECLKNDLVQLIGTRTEDLINALECHILTPQSIEPFQNPFGDGKAGQYITKEIKNYFKL